MKNFSFFIFSFLFIFSGTAFGQVIYTVAGNGTPGYSGDGGAATSAELNKPYGVVVDDSNNLYICDVYNSCIRKVSPGYMGTITTIAGNGFSGYYGDSGKATHAELHGANDLAIDHYGNVYIADANNNRIRKVLPNGIIVTIAGTGTAGYNGDSIAAISAELNEPSGIAIDKKGNIYIADVYNNRIRKIDTSGIITTIAGGRNGFTPDGCMADTMKLDLLYSIRLDSSGELFFLDNIRVRKINKDGIVSTIAGNGNSGYTGDGGIATSAEISGGAIAIDNNGNLFIADGSSGVIRQVNKSGIISTIAGNGVGSPLGDGGNPLLAGLAVPQGVAVNNEGDIYIGDVGHNRVRLVTTHLSVGEVSKGEKVLTIYPNPSKGQFNILLNTAIKQKAELKISTSDGRMLYRTQLQTNETVPIATALPVGFYIINISAGQQHFNDKLIIR